MLFNVTETTSRDIQLDEIIYCIIKPSLKTYYGSMHNLMMLVQLPVPVAPTGNASETTAITAIEFMKSGTAIHFLFLSLAEPCSQL